MVVMSMNGAATGTPHSTWYSVVYPYSPSIMIPTSVLVPPMSRVTSLSLPASSPK